MRTLCPARNGCFASSGKWQESLGTCVRGTSKKLQTSVRISLLLASSTLSTRMNGAITCDEFVNFMYTIECQDVRGRLQILFSMYDMDGTGGLNLAELIQLLLVSADGQPQRMLLQSFLAGAPAVFLGC